MSKYTTEVRFICESYAGRVTSGGYGEINDIISKSWNKVFDFDFPMFDESYRSLLCKKILKHYYTREIGEETVGLWKLRLDSKLNEIMPYFNQMYETTTYEFNPLYNLEITTTHEGSDSGNSSGRVTGSDTTDSTDTGQSNSRNTTGDAYSDTPQGGLTNVENLAYLSNYRRVQDEGEVSNTRTGYSARSNESSDTKEYASTDSYVNHVIGKTSSDSYGKLIQEYRKSLINIDMMIIEELGDLFMNLW